VNAARRIAAIARKELQHLARDRLTGGMVFGLPIMMTLLFGFAINQDVRHLRAGVADLAQTQRSRALVSDAQATQVVDITHQVESAAALEELLVAGRISVGLLIPRDFEQRVEHGERAAAQLLANGSDPVVLGAMRGLERLSIERRAVPGAGPPPPTFETRIYFNPERRTALFIVPGLLGVILTLTMVLFTSAAIVRERERGNLEFLITTPVRTPELMMGKIAPYVAIGLVQVSLILSIGALFFDLPMRGRLPELYLAALVYVVAVLGLGLLFSTVAQTQFQAFQLTFVSFLPQILLGGFMFPFEGMPRWAQWIGEVIPLTHFLRIARGIVLRGAGLVEVWPDVWPLLVFSVVTIGAATARFRKRLD
jgi:ABC-2 type transport system permease protein